MEHNNLVKITVSSGMCYVQVQAMTIDLLSVILTSHFVGPLLHIKSNYLLR